MKIKIKKKKKKKKKKIKKKKKKKKKKLFFNSIHILTIKIIKFKFNFLNIYQIYDFTRIFTLRMRNKVNRIEIEVIF